MPVQWYLLTVNKVALPALALAVVAISAGCNSSALSSARPATLTPRSAVTPTVDLGAQLAASAQAEASRAAQAAAVQKLAAARVVASQAAVKRAAEQAAAKAAADKVAAARAAAQAIASQAAVKRAAEQAAAKAAADKLAAARAAAQAVASQAAVKRAAEQAAAKAAADKLAAARAATAKTGCGQRAVTVGKFDPSCAEYQGYLDPGTAVGRAPTSGEIQHAYGCQQGYISRSECTQRELATGKP